MNGRCGNYIKQRNIKGQSAIARSYGNTAIDNLINAHREVHTADTAEEQQHDLEQIEKAAAAAVVKTIEKALK